MRIVVVGCGKLGFAIAQELVKEGHTVSVVDAWDEALARTMNHLDVSGTQGSGTDVTVLEEAGVGDADVVIAATQSDEANIVCAILSKKLGAGHTIARIREIGHARSMGVLRTEMGSGININPEMEAAEEISRIFRFPSALKIDFFARGRVEIIEIAVGPEHPLAGMKLSELSGKMHAQVLVCTVIRDGQIIIPDGEFVLQAGDKIGITGTMKEINQFFKRAGVSGKKIKSVMVVGGGRIGYNLSRILLESGMNVKILESDREQCERLSALLPKATVVHCDGTAQDVLLDEGVNNFDGLAALTGLDEENVIISMFAQSEGVSKVVTKVNHITFGGILEKAGIDCVITPHAISAGNICRYVRALQNSEDSSFETLISLVGGAAEGIEFKVGNGFAGNNVPLKDLKLKKNILIPVIIRGGKVLYPKGDDAIMAGDNIVVVTTGSHVKEISDILQ